MKKLKNTNKGITLIALIITIIVMLILVAVTISMAINGGLFDYAGKAVGDTQNAINKEQQLASGKVTVGGKIYDSIDDYIAGEVSLLSYDETEKDGNGMLTSNATYKSEDYTAVIPKGFKIVEGLNGTTTIADGLVIQDEEGNEFVWIPVEVTETDTETSIAAFYRSNWKNNERGTIKYKDTTGDSYNEPLSSGGYTNEVSEYNEMLKSVYKNKGFYIGRFEAGTTLARVSATTGTSKLVVQRDAYPYTYVGWGKSMNDYTSNVLYSNTDIDKGKGALLLSKELYGTEEKTGKYGVTSTLCYGIMWDAMLDFIKTEKNVTTSTNWGNYKDNLWTITRKTARYFSGNYSTQTWSLIDDLSGDKKVKTSSETIYLTTGASDEFAAKNIFDVAGNFYEWTNEAYINEKRVYRGRVLS